MGQSASCENEESRGQPQQDAQIQALLLQQQLQMLQQQPQYEVGQFKQEAINHIGSNNTSQILQDARFQQFPIIAQPEVVYRDNIQRDQQVQRIPNNNLKTNSNNQSNKQYSYLQQDLKTTSNMIIPQTSSTINQFQNGMNQYLQQQHSQNLIGEKDMVPISQQQQFHHQQQQQLQQTKIDTLKDGILTQRTTLRPSTKYNPSSQIKEKHLEDPSDEDVHLSMNFSPQKSTIQSNFNQPLVSQVQVQSIQPAPSKTATKPRYLSPHSQQTQSTAKPIISLDGIGPAVQLSIRKPTRSPKKMKTQEINYEQQTYFLQPQHPASATTPLPSDFKIQKLHELKSFENSDTPNLLKQQMKNSITNILNPKNTTNNEGQSYKLIQQSQQFQQPHSAEEEKSNDQIVHNKLQAQQLDGFLSSTSLGYQTQERQMRTPSLQQSNTLINSKQPVTSQQTFQIQQQQMQFKQQEELLKQFQQQQEMEYALKSKQLMEQQQFQKQQQENIQIQQKKIKESQQEQFKINSDFEVSKTVLLEKNNPINTKNNTSQNNSQSASASVGVEAARGRENINQLKNTTSQQPEKSQIKQQQKHLLQQEKQQKYDIYQQQVIPKNNYLNSRSKSKKRFAYSSDSSEESPPSFKNNQDSYEEQNQNYQRNTHSHNDFNNHLKPTKSSREKSSKPSKRSYKSAGTSSSHQITEQPTRISHRHSHNNNKFNSINAGISNTIQYSHQSTAGQKYNEDYPGFNSQTNLNPASFYSNPSIYNQSQQQQYPQIHMQHSVTGHLQNRHSVGNTGYPYPLVNQQQYSPQQPQLVSPFQMIMSTQNLGLQQTQNSPADFIQQQLVQSQLALAQAQQNHQAQIQGILLMQQQQQQQQHLQQQQLQTQYGGMFAAIPNQLLGTQLNQMNTLNQYPLANQQIDNYAKNPYQGNNNISNYFNTINSPGIIQPTNNMSGNVQQICNTGNSESNKSISMNQFSQQVQQQSLPGIPQQFPIIINNNVVSPTKQLIQTHLGDNLIHLQAENNTQSPYQKHLHSSTNKNNKKTAQQKNYNNLRYQYEESAERQETNPELVNNQVLVDSSLSEVDQHKQQRQEKIPLKIDKQKEIIADVKEVDVLDQNIQGTKQGQEIQYKPDDNSYLENNTNTSSKLKKYNSFSEYNKNKIDSDLLNIEEKDIKQQNNYSNIPNGNKQAKTLAEIFQEKRGKLAVQKMEEQQQQQEQQLGTAWNKTQTTVGGKRTKEEIIKLRQDMKEYGSKVNPKLKAKQQQKIHHADSDITGDVVLKDQRDKSPIYSKQKEELMIRLAQGVKPKISEKEMYALTKKNYENLPEVKKKRQEQEKQMNKSEMLKVKQEKLKELDEKRKTQLQRKPQISQLNSPKTVLSNYNSVNQLHLAEEAEVLQ